MLMEPAYRSASASSTLPMTADLILLGGGCAKGISRRSLVGLSEVADINKLPLVVPSPEFSESEGARGATLFDDIWDPVPN